jgi:hypothetical protein
LTACTHPAEKSADAVVQIGNSVLTRGELADRLPSFRSPEDSLLAAEHFIRVWINDQLLYNIAQRNIVDKNTIDQLVEDYRRSLIIYQYQEQLINEKLVTGISEQELHKYYEENRDKFKLEKPLIKGLFFRLPIDAPHIERAREWGRKLTPASINNLEKYSTQNAGSFNYFETQWVDFNELIAGWPVMGELDLAEALKKSSFFEQKDDKYYYFLTVNECLLPGDNSPFQFAESTVKELLINQKKMDFLRKTENDLYNKALKSGQIKFYNE